MSGGEEVVEQLDIRTCWQHEARDFTPWLARNLDLLGKELGTKLEFVDREKLIGPFSLDILARDADTGVLVAIENQLEETDLSHLGQLLTYATGCDAKVAVWVASEFRHECANALHRLNEWTKDEIKFYGVKISVIKQGDSPPELRLQKVVYPGGWDEDLTEPHGATMSPQSQRHRDFFEPVIAELVRTGFADKRPVHHFDHTGRFFRSRVDGALGYAITLEAKTDAWVTFHIQKEDNDLTKRIFDELQANREDIESSLGAVPGSEWDWRRWDKKTFSSINIRRDGSIDDPVEKLEEIKVWMLDLLPRLREVFDPRVAEILGESRVTDDR